MAITVTHGQSISGGGVSIQPEAITESGSGSIGIEESLSVAQAGVLSTRTDDDTGTITMDDAGHTITTGAVVDIYWATGMRYGVTVGTVSGTSVPFGALGVEGSGDVLPAVNTAVTVIPQTSVNVTIDGDNVKLIAVMLQSNTKSLRTAGHVQFRDSANAEIHELDLVANVPQVWHIAGGSANPFTGNPVTNLKISQGDTTANEDFTLKIVGVQDASP